MAIIDHADLAGYLGRSIAAGAHQTAVTEIIDGLEGDLEAHLKRPLVPTDIEDEVVEIRGGKVFPKATPVISVASFTVDGVAIESTQYDLKEWGLLDIWPGFLPSPLISPAPEILLSYRGGLPGDEPTSAFGRKARATLLRAAARDYNQVVREDLAGVARAGVEGTNLEFHGGVRAGAGGLTDDEKKQFDRWKRRILR